MGQRVLICGDRYWSNIDLIRDVIYNMKDIDVIIEGECSGADVMGRIIANELCIQVLPYPANWLRYGRGAGPIRNQQMLDEGKPTLVLAFHNNINKSKGTKDMVERAKKNKIPVQIITEWGNTQIVVDKLRGD